MNKTEQKISRSIKEYRLLEKNDKVLAAFSGGPDSAYLLWYLNKYADYFGIKIAAAHLNHSLRGDESDRDENFCREFCEKQGIEFHSEKKDIAAGAGNSKLSVEEYARNARYSFFNRLCAEHGYMKIATGHNSGDNAETVILNLIKGTGISGISGIPVKRGNIIRPLLAVSRDEIMTEVGRMGIPYVTDSTNLQSEYERNFIRQEVIPLIKSRLNPSLEDTIARSSSVFGEMAEFIKNEVESLRERYTSYSNNVLYIDIASMEKEPDSLKLLGELLKVSVLDYFDRDIAYYDVERIKSLKDKQTGTRENISGGLEAVRDRGMIIVRQTEEREGKEISFRMNSEASLNGITVSAEKTGSSETLNNPVKEEEIISADNLEDIFILRSWKKGDKFKPLGMKGFKKVSDFLTEQKVDASLKKNYPVLVNRNNIIWIVGLRIDDRYKITGKAKTYCKLRKITDASER